MAAQNKKVKVRKKQAVSFGRFPGNLTVHRLQQAFPLAQGEWPDMQ